MDKYFREAEVKSDESEPSAVSILLSASEMQPRTDATWGLQLDLHEACAPAFPRHKIQS